MYVSRNILAIDWKLPSDEVYILGTGPNGAGHYDKVPRDAWTIGVNKAIELWPKIPVSIWLCADGTLPSQKWFQENVHVFIRLAHPLTDNQNPTPVFCTGVLLNTYPDVPYYFTHGRTLRDPPPFTPEEGVLRAGGSIGAQAIQLAYWLGAKRIVLVGVDMAGDTYFDGTKNINPRLMKDGVSLHCRMCGGLCQWLGVRGVEVVSLSKTALKVPVVDK